MKANKLRKLYLDFFKSKQHKIISSAPIVVKDDPTLMFVNAGMNQFKDIFLGDSEPKHMRIANSQKCLRVSGKHNDLEEVGHDTYHHTMFEMLGSWSFGDYFKQDAISWAWQFLIEICKLDKDRIYVTVFEGKKEEGLDKDNEAFDIWRKHISPDRILYGNKQDNFWEMGEIGPCGPCSEIHFDIRSDAERLKINGSDLVNKDHPQVIEIWNLVFMQYQLFADGIRKPLPKSHVDTGMGLERLAMVMQSAESNYETDIFKPIIKTISKISSLAYGDNDKQDIAMRVIADHIRAISFSIADGQLPSNVKAGYVIRRILRRAVRYGYTYLNLRDPFIYKLVDVIVGQMGDQFVELGFQKELIKKVVKEEEESFFRTLEDGLKRIEQIKNSNTDKISGALVFELYDTYGFPADLTALILGESKLSFNQSEFDIAMQAQKERSKVAAKIETGDWTVLIDDEIEEFVGYKNLEVDIKITKYRKIISNDEEQYQLVFNLTPFYPQGGGQIGDKGVIVNDTEEIKIFDTKKENKVIIHFSNQLPNDIHAVFKAKVNIEERKSISRNHTATHLLHESLRTILGSHVEQKGSLVNSKYLRFDFTHFSKIEYADLYKIEKDVNNKILANIILKEYNNLSLKQAQDLGAIMLFGERYEDVVRMIEFGSSKELCGGTHVLATVEIGLFKILSESSTSSGIRRIEAISGVEALNYLNKKEDLLSELSKLIKNKDLKKGLQELISTNKGLEKKLEKLKKSSLVSARKDLLKLASDSGGIRLIAQEVEMEAKDMKDMSFALRKENNLALVLASKLGDRVLLSVMLSDDLLKRDFHAGVIIKELAKEINGSGGGQPFFATAGGDDFSGIDAALLKVRQIIR